VRSVFTKIVNSNRTKSLLLRLGLSEIPFLRPFLEFFNVKIIPTCIAFFTKSPNNILGFFRALFTRTHLFPCFVSRHMTASRSYNKVFRSVIVFYPVYMVDYFCRFKKSAKCYFHNKAASFDIRVVSLLIGITGVIRIIYKNIALLFDYSTLPITHNGIITHFERKNR